MAGGNKPLVLVWFVVLVGAVVGLSILSTQLWVQKSEEIPPSTQVVIEEGMTVGQFGEANGLEGPILKELFGLAGQGDLEKPLADFNLTTEQIQEKVNQARVLEAEHESKDWRKILIKFGLWFAFLIAVFFLLRGEKVTPLMRKFLYLLAIAVFGVVLGADPSPMGTVKDAIHLFAVSKVVFPPRMIALGVFLLIVFLANKFICSWGCQFGVLQDMIFRLNRNAKDSKGIFPQYKPSFLFSNTVRVLFLAAFTVAAVLWAVDIIEFYDPFKIYKPLVLLWYGIAVIGALLVLSLFVYRPWCHFFCPFGLVGWLVEKISLAKIKVNYETCIACEACAKACPSTVMSAILKRDKAVIPDCFSCGTCMGVCPTDSISFGAGKRQKPPADHFINKREAQAAS